MCGLDAVQGGCCSRKHGCAITLPPRACCPSTLHALSLRDRGELPSTALLLEMPRASAARTSDKVMWSRSRHACRPAAPHRVVRGQARLYRLRLILAPGTSSSARVCEVALSAWLQVCGAYGAAMARDDGTHRFGAECKRLGQIAGKQCGAAVGARRTHTQWHHRWLAILDLRNCHNPMRTWLVNYLHLQLQMPWTGVP